MENCYINSLLIRSLIGVSLDAAGVILNAMDVAGWISLAVGLTGVGATASGIILAQRAAIMGVCRRAGRMAAKAY
ncbi:MAG: hypothetical protein LBT69_04840 [Lactobacillales bacterium]|jgi:hypothetical protein|nr:hypothetical protein [Lactobacillales bacterium]